MSTYLKNLEWRYATKKFDNIKKVSEQDLETLKEAIQLSASSYGLQPYKVLIVSDQETKEKLKPAAWNQTQITDASHLIIFASIDNLNDSHVDEYINNISKTRNLEASELEGFSGMIKGTLAPLSEDMKSTWAAKQTYIALGNLLSAAADLKIDTCPMEGFNAEQFKEILGLDKLGLTPTVIAPVGYRAEDDAYQHLKKVRKPSSDLFMNI
ncbi:NAD(P)H-dependent oxidoreductase [Galbibacter mesophilus]|uniref:NAD(P)H-dependent oxidoreductase n=1 Tax=Galbibacter mesophilus TaxID=379069 RepID=UPI00191FE217|nr:NAD(P)H-dependent oxidoreductase [Galbibacter mesophilus]MCM5661630.1 NAD(P)H-dependent oxidoreductase [Galbibacter mesophilus]